MKCPLVDKWILHIKGYSPEHKLGMKWHCIDKPQSLHAMVDNKHSAYLHSILNEDLMGNISFEMNYSKLVFILFFIWNCLVTFGLSCVSFQEIPPPGSYDVEESFEKSQVKLERKKARSEAGARKQGSFMSSSSRFAPPRDIPIPEQDADFPGKKLPLASSFLVHIVCNLSHCCYSGLIIQASALCKGSTSSGCYTCWHIKFFTLYSSIFLWTRFKLALW